MITRRRTYYNMLGGLFDNMKFIRVNLKVNSSGYLYIDRSDLSRYGIDIDLPILISGYVEDTKNFRYMCNLELCYKSTKPYLYCYSNGNSCIATIVLNISDPDYGSLRITPIIGNGIILRNSVVYMTNVDIEFLEGL